MLFLDDVEKSNLIEYVRNYLLRKLQICDEEFILNEPLKQKLTEHMGVFVSFYNKDELRACMGQMRSNEPVYELVKNVAFTSLKRDHRFKAITADELPSITIEISVIGPMVKIDDISEIVIGKHGIYISKAGFNGTFLPQVATEYGWSVEEFLGHCSESKVGIGWDGWRNSEIYVYETLVIRE